LTPTNHGISIRAKKDVASVTDASDALRQAREFMSEVSGPPESQVEEARLTNTMHALDHASRLAEAAGKRGEIASMPDGSEDLRAAELCAEAMRNAVLVADQVGALPEVPHQAASVEALREEKAVAANEASTEQAIVRLKQCAKALRKFQQVHRQVTLSSVASGAVSADEAIARVDNVRRLESLARRAWRSAAYLVGNIA
jgi:phosphate:Na+ symporter